MKKIIVFVSLMAVFSANYAASYPSCPKSIQCYVDPTKTIPTAKKCALLIGWQFDYYSGAGGSGDKPGWVTFKFLRATLDKHGKAYCHLVAATQFVVYQSIKSVQPATEASDNDWSPKGWHLGQTADCIPQKLRHPEKCPLLQNES